MKIIKDRIIKVLAVLLIIFGIYFMLAPIVKNHMMQGNIEKLLETTKEEIRENRQKESTIDFADVRKISTDAAFRAMRNSDDIHVIGRIQIEAIDLDLPVVNSLTDETLYFGAGMMKSGQVMGEGNYSLASHRMRNPNLLFSPLDRIEIGDKIVISDDTGSYTYEAIKKEVIEAEGVHVIDDIEGDRLITLITCTNEGSQRLMVRGELVEASI